MGAFADAFAEQLKSAVNKAELAGTRVAHKAVYYFLADAVENSPVRMPERWHKKYPSAAPGHYKNNWQVGINIEPENDIPGSDSSGEAAISRAEEKLLTNITVGKKTIHLVNNAKSIPAGGNTRSTFDNDGATLSQLESYAQAIEDGVGIERSTWAYELSDRGITAPGAVLGRAKVNWGLHVQKAKLGMKI